MKYYGHTSLASFLKVILNALIVLGAAVFLTVLGRAVINEGKELLNVTTIITCILFITGGFSLLAIMYNLRKIITSLIKVTPFIKENIKSLKDIAMYCFIITACYVINFFVNGQYKNFIFVEIDKYGVHTDIEFLIFFFAGCFIMILSEVFKQAVEVKEENDFTI
jgi:hypothetical protein